MDASAIEVRIRLRLRGIDLELTVEEARAIVAQLQELLGSTYWPVSVPTVAGPPYIWFPEPFTVTGFSGGTNEAKSG